MSTSTPSYLADATCNPGGGVGVGGVGVGGVGGVGSGVGAAAGAASADVSKAPTDGSPSGVAAAAAAAAVAAGERDTVDMDSYAIIPASTLFSHIVPTVLRKLGYGDESIFNATGSHRLSLMAAIVCYRTKKNTNLGPEDVYVKWSSFLLINGFVY